MKGSENIKFQKTSTKYQNLSGILTDNIQKTITETGPAFDGFKTSQLMVIKTLAWNVWVI